MKNEKKNHFNMSIMDQIVNVHTVPQRAMDCRPGLGELNQVYVPDRPTPSA